MVQRKEKKLKIVYEKDIEGFKGICGWVKELIDPNNSDVENLNMALITVEPGKSSEPHYHGKTEEIYYILEGIGVLTYDEQKQEISGGCAIYIPPGKTHMITNVGRQILKLLSINAPPYDPDDTHIVKT